MTSTTYSSAIDSPNPFSSGTQVLCFGGTFNPIHHGHLLSARAVAEAAGFTKVLLIPSHVSPHKLTGVAAISSQHRLTICRLAVRGDPLFDVSDIEISRSGTSYTIDTVRALRGLGWPEVHWLIGADMLPTLPTWRESAALLHETTFHVVSRKGFPIDWARLPNELQPLRPRTVEVPSFELSSTAIRERAARRLSLRYLLPEAAFDYIRQNDLYRPAESRTSS